MRTLFFIIAISLVTWKSGYTQSLEYKLQNTLDSICTAENLVGISAAVRLGNQLVWSGTSGYNNPFTLDTLGVEMNGSIASNTKMFTSAVVLQLVSEGKISLEDTIGNWQASIPDISGRITIRQLLNHTSGLGDYTNQAWVESIQANPAYIWTVDELFDAFLSDPIGEPGGQYSYSNAGYIILGSIIEAIEQKPYSQVLHERIFEPLAMTYSYTPFDDKPASELILPWFDIDNDGDLDNMLDYSMNAIHSTALSAGYIHSTPEDLTLLLPALFDNMFFGDDLLNQMKTTIPATSNYRYGLGLFEYIIFDKPYYGHTGGYVGYQSFTCFEPESKLSVAFLLNQTYANTYDIGKGLVQKAYDYILSTQSYNDLTSSFHLNQNYPNPFRDFTTISYTIPVDDYISLKVYNSIGNEVVTVSELYQKAGTHQIAFDAGNLRDGLYFLTLFYGDKNQTRSFVISR